MAALYVLSHPDGEYMLQRCSLKNRAFVQFLLSISKKAWGLKRHYLNTSGKNMDPVYEAL